MIKNSGRCAWTDQGASAKELLMTDREKQYWDTKCQLTNKRGLLAFVEQLVHDHEVPFENAMKYWRLPFDGSLL